MKMKYQGSKSRHAKELLAVILQDRKEGQYFYDLFCGGGGICDKVQGNVVGNDYNMWTIEALKFIRDELNKIPRNNKEFTEQDYIDVKNNDIVNNLGLTGYIGFALSYGDKWFGGWRRDKLGKRDYVAEAYRNAIKQSPNLQHVTFTNLSYDEVELQPNSIIYLDPPYFQTTKYSTGGFDYDKFYQWCIDKHNEGHKVFISEYFMPEKDFKCIWSKQVNSSLTKDTGSKKNIEKLFIPIDKV
jgi:DNA adenine methylase